ncbi:MAG: hemerythrin domain-containing protein [Myxococcota bacterium]
MNAKKHPWIPRNEWTEHPRFPSQVLLLGSHANFRNVSEYLVEHARKDAQPARLESLYRRWISAMRSHESYEESKLYPYLARRWDTSFAPAEEGHHALHEAHANVLEAFEGLDNPSDDQRARDTLVDALSEHDRVLASHLELEEDMVIPLLLELEPDEFDTYCNSSIRTLMARLDAQDVWGS